MQLISAPLQVTCMKSSLSKVFIRSFGDTDTKFAESHSSENYEILLMFRQAVTVHFIASPVKYVTGNFRKCSLNIG